MNARRPGLGREIVCVSTQAASATVGYKTNALSLERREVSHEHPLMVQCRERNSE